MRGRPDGGRPNPRKIRTSISTNAGFEPLAAGPGAPPLPLRAAARRATVCSHARPGPGVRLPTKESPTETPRCAAVVGRKHWSSGLGRSPDMAAVVLCTRMRPALSAPARRHEPTGRARRELPAAPQYSSVHGGTHQRRRPSTGQRDRQAQNQGPPAPGRESAQRREAPSREGHQGPSPGARRPKPGQPG